MQGRQDAPLLDGLCWFLGFLEFGEAGVVEEVLLGVAGVGAEVGVGEVSDAGGGDVAFAAEVELPEDALDPDVDGDGGEAFAGEEEDAVGDLFADSVEFHEMGAGIGIVQGGEEGEVDVSLADVGGGAVEEGGAVA